ncbi:hypothetical protein KIJ96_11950 [Pseudoalteromonas piscicida]|uniref:choice-of-anchor U domain-containing protein n=1 Tax=Pseudoalteromonas piscicida TaxID=43662 RepID=UPI001D0BD067|nr:choice-of-anchor U domain-containing protein [Pseudoalteromonas piscicida]UDM60543.1 hypothetical protein KIJ96_11950 [Pseudoalteromonas piscicida]
MRTFTFRLYILLLCGFLSACNDANPEKNEQNTKASYKVVTTYTGAGSIVPESLNIEAGSSATFELRPDEGYYLADATGCHGLLDKEKLNYHVNNVNDSCSIDVSFKPLKLSIKTNFPEGASLTLDKPDYFYGDSLSAQLILDASHKVESITGCQGQLVGEYYQVAKLVESCEISLKTLTPKRTFTDEKSGQQLQVKVLDNAGVIATSSQGIISKDEPNLPAMSNDIVLPFQLLAIDIATTPGADVLVELTYPSAVSEQSRYIKSDGETWYFMPTEFAQLAADKRSIVLHLQDGGYGDSDGVANGIIKDPGGIAELQKIIVQGIAYEGGSISPNTQTVSYGDSTIFTLSPDEGFGISDVTGCSGTLTGNTYTTGMVTSACQVSASFSPHTFNVDASAGEGGGISPSTQTVSYGDSATFTLVADEGYEISGVTGCNGTLTDNTYTTGVITSACQINASFSQQTFTVDASAGEGGGISPSTQIINYGDTARFTVTPDVGFSIAEVSGCNGTLVGNTYITGTITSACQVSVSFNQKSFTVDASAGEGGTISPSTQTVAYGGTVSFTLIPSEGFEISEASGCSGSLNNYVYSTGEIREPCFVQAEFSQIKPELSVDAGEDILGVSGNTVNLRPSVDTQNKIKAVRWQQVSGPTLAIENVNSLETLVELPSLPFYGYAELEITVSDDSGNEARDRVKVEITQNIEVPILIDDLTVTNVAVFHTENPGIRISTGEFDENSKAAFFEKIRIEKNKLYYVTVSGSINNSESQNAVEYGLVFNHDILDNGMAISLLSDIIYQAVAQDIRNNNLNEQLSHFANILINDLNSDGTISYRDISYFHKGLESTFMGKSKYLLSDYKSKANYLEKLNFVFKQLESKLVISNDSYFNIGDKIYPNLTEKPLGTSVRISLNNSDFVNANEGLQLQQSGINKVSISLSTENGVFYKTDRQLTVLEQEAVEVATIVADQDNTVHLVDNTNTSSEVYFPVGSSGGDLTISAKLSSAESTHGINGVLKSDILTLEPSGTTFDVPVTIKLAYHGDIDPESIIATRISQGNVIESIKPIYVDTSSKHAYFQTTHFTDFILEKDIFGKSESEEVIHNLELMVKGACDNKNYSGLTEEDCERLYDFNDDEWVEILNLNGRSNKESEITIFDIFSSWYLGKSIYKNLTDIKDDNTDAYYINLAESFHKFKDKEIYTNSLANQYNKLAEAGFSFADFRSDAQLVLEAAEFGFNFFDASTLRNITRATGLINSAIGILPTDFVSWYLEAVITTPIKEMKKVSDKILGIQIEAYASLRDKGVFDFEEFISAVQMSFNGDAFYNDYVIQHGFLTSSSYIPAGSLTEPEEIRAFWVNLDLFLQRYELYKLAVSDQEPTGNLKEIFSDPQILAEDGRMLDIILSADKHIRKVNDESVNIADFKVFNTSHEFGLFTKKTEIKVSNSEIKELDSIKFSLLLDEVSSIEADELIVNIETESRDKVLLACVSSENSTIACSGEHNVSPEFQVYDYKLSIETENNKLEDEKFKVSFIQNQSNISPFVAIISPVSNKLTSGENVSLPADYNDPDGYILSRRWYVKMGEQYLPFSVSDSIATFTIPETDEEKILTVYLEVKDNEGARTSDQIYFRVYPKQQGNISKFSSSWLNGKTLYNVYFSGNDKSFQLTEITFSDREARAVVNGRNITLEYTIVDGFIRIDDGSDVDYIGIYRSEPDKLLLCWGRDAFNNCSGEAEEYFFYDRELARKYIQAAPGRHKYSVFAGNNRLANHNEWLTPLEHGYKKIGDTDSASARRFYGSYRYYVIMVEDNEYAHIDAVKDHNGNLYQTYITSNVLNHQNLANGVDGNYAELGYYGKSYMVIEVNEHTRYIKVYPH